MIQYRLIHRVTALITLLSQLPLQVEGGKSSVFCGGLWQACTSTYLHYLRGKLKQQRLTHKKGKKKEKKGGGGGGGAVGGGGGGIK